MPLARNPKLRRVRIMMTIMHLVAVMVAAEVDQVEEDDSLDVVIRLDVLVADVEVVVVVVANGTRIKNTVRGVEIPMERTSVLPSKTSAVSVK